MSLIAGFRKNHSAAAVKSQQPSQNTPVERIRLNKNCQETGFVNLKSIIIGLTLRIVHDKERKGDPSKKSNQSNRTTSTTMTNDCLTNKVYLSDTS